VLQDHPLVNQVATNGKVLKVILKPEARDYSELPTLLVERGHKLTLFREEELSLESAFMALTKGMGQKT
jgi:ABC-2 type transport system ATP-binding protein